MKGTFPAHFPDRWRAGGAVPADVAVVRRVEHSPELSSQPQAVRVLARVRVVEEQNHQQEKHVKQEILKKKNKKASGLGGHVHPGA